MNVGGQISKIGRGDKENGEVDRKRKRWLCES